MNTANKIEIIELIQKSVDNNISEEEFSNLNAMLRDSDEACQFYHEIMRIYLKLEEHGNRVGSTKKVIEEDILSESVWEAMAEYEKMAPTIEIPKEKPQQELIQKVVYPPLEKHKMSRFSIYTLVASAAAVLFLILFARFAPQRQHAMEVATLIDQTDVEWADLATSLSEGDRLLTHQPPFTLAKGIVKIQYDQGVDVLIEGPAAFELERSGMFLSYGRLYSRVSESGLGFKVETPTSQFVDLGTEFGIQADVEGSTQLHVIKGKVQLFAGLANGEKHTQAVTTGNALAYNANVHEIKAVKYDNTRFVSDIDQKTKLPLRGDANLHKAAVLASMPTAYYRFEKGKEALGFDEINRSTTVCDFSGWVTLAEGPAIDPDHENRSLYFAGGPESKVFLLDKVIEKTQGTVLSVSLWVRPEPGKEGLQNVICYTNSEKQTDVLKLNQVFLTNDKRVCFGFHNISLEQQAEMGVSKTDENGEITEGFILIAPDPLPLNQWSHVVACYSNQQIELYVNGRLCDTIKFSTKTYHGGYDEGGYWAIGSSAGASPTKSMYFRGTPKSNYRGGLDELSFYDRKLSAQEVRLLYETGRQ